MLFYVLALFLIIITCIHMFLNLQKGFILEKKMHFLSLTNWTCSALVLGLSAGSLSLTSFELSTEEIETANVFMDLGLYSIVISFAVVPLVGLIIVKRKREHEC